MSLFGKKKDDGGASPDGEPNGKIVYSPEKAAKFFQHARVKDETGNYEYAAQMWLGGLRWDPASLPALESFFKSMSLFMQDNPKGPSKDTIKMFEGRGDTDRYLAALLEWGAAPLESARAVRAAEAAAKLNLAEPTHFIGNAALNALRQDRKAKKDNVLKLMEAFRRVNALDKALEAGEFAVRMDPSDGSLAADVKNLAAQSTMSKGGYDQAGQAGGFRANVKDLTKQRQLEEGDRIVKTVEAADRLVNEAKAQYDARPNDVPSITMYIRRLLERGRDEDERLARDIASKAYESTREFRFRETVGEIQMRRAFRRLSLYRDQAAKSPGDVKAAEVLKEAERQFAKLELDEYRLRSEAYPTEQRWKFEVAKRMFALGEVDSSIPLFQEAASDAKLRTEALQMLGRAFLKIEYIDEAIDAFRRALENHKVTSDERGMSLNYDLMAALQTKATKERDRASAMEADKLASSIAIQQFNYLDIRQRRDVIKKLIAELKQDG
jgi:tetratricopeptide (TPR) repeat protein